MPRLERDRPVIMGYGLIPTTEREQDQSHVAMVVRDSMVQCDGLADQVQGLVIVAGMIGDDAK